MVFIALGIIPTCLCKITFVVPSPYYDAVLFFAYPVRGPSASEVTRFVAGAQVFFHCRTVVFQHLNVFCTSGRVLWPGVVVSPLSIVSSKTGTRAGRIFFLDEVRELSRQTAEN